MYEPFLIVDDTLRNVVSDGGTTGFEMQVRCGYYRRLILSMVEDLGVWVDGEQVPREAITFSLRGREWALDELVGEFVEAWEFGEPAGLRVARPGGLTAGEHRIRLREQLRISYLPRPSVNDVERTELKQKNFIK